MAPIAEPTSLNGAAIIFTAIPAALLIADPTPFMLDHIAEPIPFTPDHIVEPMAPIADPTPFMLDHIAEPVALIAEPTSLNGDVTIFVSV